MPSGNILHWGEIHKQVNTPYGRGDKDSGKLAGKRHWGLLRGEGFREGLSAKVTLDQRDLWEMRE